MPVSKNTIKPKQKVVTNDRNEKSKENNEQV